MVREVGTEETGSAKAQRHEIAWHIRIPWCFSFTEAQRLSWEVMENTVKRVR